MKITKQRLKDIIREELMTERLATVPQVQQMAAAAGVRLSYGDAKTLAANTPAERGALMRLQQAFKDGSWRRMTEELNEANRFPPDMTGRAAHSAAYGDSSPSLGDLQSDEKFTGGSPEERLLTLMKARELLAAMSKEELTQLSLSLDGETTRALQHLLANPMYKEQ
jgi:hypothetical protein